jgi:hypothetical protein
VQRRRAAGRPAALAAVLTARVSVPGKIRHRLTAAAQFIENFKHRKTLVKAMDECLCAAGRAVAAAPLAGGAAHAAGRRHLVRRHAAQRAGRPSAATGPRCRA